MCFTWSNSDGKLCPHVNGEVLTCFTDYKTGETIPGNGQFILGQEQDAYGKLFIRERKTYFIYRSTLNFRSKKVLLDWLLFFLSFCRQNYIIIP